MENTDREQLIALVKEEAEKLKIHASEYELNQLDKRMVDPQRTTRCIYGQMTGSCFSDRATTLIELCASKVYKASHKGIFSGSTLNGSPKQYSRIDRMSNWETPYWSPIEFFINDEWNYERKKNIYDLIDYLKGETEALEFY